MARFSSFLAALMWTACLLGSAHPAHAEEQDALVVQPAPAEDGSVMFVFATVEGERIELRQTRTAKGQDLLDARPIIEQLRGTVKTEGVSIEVRRFQDGAKMSIDVTEGRVEANGQVLGKINGWEARETADTWLDANAIAILTGTEVSEGEDGALVFTLDERLRPQFDLEVWVEGRRITIGDVEPRTIGPVLLIPLDDIVDALGHSLEISDETGFITVTRVQDTARITLDPNTGAIAVNDRFVGISPSMGYSEPADRLFPSSAVETLTGTHIKLLPGTNRVEINLDDRLGGGVLPDAYVLDQARETPFTLERFDYQFASEGAQDLAIYAHGGTLNGVGSLTTAGGFQDPSSLRPSRLSIDVESLRGWRASLGDVNSQYRELSGSGVGRVRGVSWRRQSEDGDILAMAAGSPLAGSRRISDSASIPSFEGIAAGARLIRPDKAEEIGFTIASQGENSRVVTEAQKAYQSDRARDKAGLRSASGTVAIGAFQGGASNSVDIEAQGSGTYRLTPQTQLRAHGTYRGASFLTRTNDELEDESSQGSRTNVRASLDWRATEDWTILKDVGAVSRMSADQAGGRTTKTAAISVGGRIGHSGPNVSVDFGQSQVSTDEGDALTASDAAIRFFQRFRWGDVQLTHQTTQSDVQSTARTVVTATAEPVVRFLGKGAVVSLSPTASLVSADGTTAGRLGATIAGDSGAAFGERFRMGGQISAAQPLDTSGSQFDLFSNLTASYYVNRYIQLSGTISQSLNGNGSAFLALRGSAPFNPPRKHTLPKDGRGVLKGRAFLDRNRDGIRQADEPGIPGLVIGLNNTRLKLAADRDGYFTIQNLKAGLYTLNVDRRSLPLGVMISEDTVLRATVAPGQITNIAVPVISSGQIRGSVFLDRDGSGDPSRGDTRLEGARVTLVPVGANDMAQAFQYAASFGQFAFESLAPGVYTLTAEFDGQTATNTVNLSEDNLMTVAHIAFTAASEPSPPSGLGLGDVVIGAAP